MKRRPHAVTVIAWLYIAAGAFGVAYHAAELPARHPIPSDFVWTELFRVIAIVCGAYLLRGSNWSRWLALAWMAYHVVLSASHSGFELAVHALLFAAFAYYLLRPGADRYFRPGRT